MHREKLSTACVFIICINLCLFMCLLDLDDLTYACKDTEVAWIYWIFWKPGETLVICYIAFFHLQNFVIVCQYFYPMCRDVCLSRKCYCVLQRHAACLSQMSEAVHQKCLRWILGDPFAWSHHQRRSLVTHLSTHSFTHISYPHNVLPSWGLLSVWANPPWHTWLFDFTSTHHSANSQIVRGIAAQVVLISSGRIS